MITLIRSGVETIFPKDIDAYRYVARELTLQCGSCSNYTVASGLGLVNKFSFRTQSPKLKVLRRIQAFSNNPSPMQQQPKLQQLDWKRNQDYIRYLKKKGELIVVGSGYVDNGWANWFRSNREI